MITEHAQTLLRLAVSGNLCEPCPTPWTAERLDEWSGPGTEHVWQVSDADESPFVYLPATVDGPAFVAWVNATAESSDTTEDQTPS